MATQASSSTTTTAPSSSSSAPVSVAPPSAAKRKFDEVISALGSVPVVAQKRAKRDTITTKNTLDKLISCAKYFVRAVHPFMDITLALSYGAQAHWAPPSPPDASNTITIPEEILAEQKKYADAFDRMMSISPSSLEVIKEFYLDDTQWPRCLKLFRDNATSARQNDTSGMKHNVTYILPNVSDNIVPHLTQTASKSERGVNHPQFRDAIIPWKLRHAIHQREPREADNEGDEEPPLTAKAIETLQLLMAGRLETGKPALTASRYPSCFYADGTFDPAKKQLGLFRSLFLLRMFMHVWTGPNSAKTGIKTVPKICNARAHSQFVATGRMIGYVCVQARTMISTSDWGTKDGKYNYERLFESVVALFETNPTSPWVVETLEWYQKSVFGSMSSSGSSESDDEDESESEADTILAARGSSASILIRQSFLTIACAKSCILNLSLAICTTAALHNRSPLDFILAFSRNLYYPTFQVPLQPSTDVFSFLPELSSNIALMSD
ncbi:hypothetical protein C8R43DRAFT_1137099 [Mycena crocata]|nr:hypothetical protein C8R43DRAFT_1137099 [Mycena crocata]